MAEFQQVMEQWRRMCDKNQTDCMRFCSICANPVCGELRNASNEDIRKAEDAIMSWAAEHPEPVYPTWAEYLVSINALYERWDGHVNDYDSAEYAAKAIRKPIPADIAEKLGLQPK